MLLLFFILFCFILILPFVPGLQELKKRADDKPLFINMEYVKNPRYFANSFKALLLKALPAEKNLTETVSITLSKNEKVQMTNDASFSPNALIQSIYYVKNNFFSSDSSVFKKEIYVGGNASIGKDNRLRALAAEGNIEIESGTHFSRWLDAEGSIQVKEGCNLGISATCAKNLSLATRCTFKRLYGSPVEIPSPAKKNLPDQVSSTEAPMPIYGQIERCTTKLAPMSQKEGSIICRASSFIVGDHTSIFGHIKTHGDLTLEDNVKVAGNIFADGNITIGSNSHIFGTVFCHGTVTIGENTIVGSLGKVKSVTAQDAIRLHSGAKIYGNLLTEGEGIVL